MLDRLKYKLSSQLPNVIIIALIIVVSILIAQNRQLKNTYLTAPGVGQLPPTLAIGSGVGDVLLQEAGGNIIELDYKETKHGAILFVSSAECDYCKIMRSKWESVISEASPHDIPVYDIVLDATAEDILIASGSGGGSYVLANRNALLSRMLEAVPATLWIDVRGEIKYIEYGEDISPIFNALRKLQ